LNGHERDFSGEHQVGTSGRPRGSFLDGYGYKANHNGRIESYGSRVEDYQTDVRSREGLSFLQRTEATDQKPFFLFLAPSAPHWPMKPARRDAHNQFTDAALPKTTELR
jgi:N-acetylglucosamine-6-sulfatase